MQAEGIGATEAPPDAHLVAAGDAERRFGFEVAEQLRARCRAQALDRLAGCRVQGAVAAGRQERRAHSADRGEAELAARKVSFKALREDRPQQLVTVEECAGLAPPNARVGLE